MRVLAYNQVCKMSLEETRKVLFRQHAVLIYLECHCVHDCSEPVEHLLTSLDLFSRQFAKLVIRVVGQRCRSDDARVAWTLGGRKC